MATNPYINTINFAPEQDLIGNLVIESIQMHGQDNLSSFTETHTIEMHIESVNGFEGEGDMLSKFGLEVRDQVVTMVSISRFLTVTGKDRPLVGDLLYFPITDKVFEIKFVEDEVPFFQLGKMHVYQITSDNNFTTTNPAVSDPTVDNAPDTDSGLVPLSPTTVDGVIDFTKTNPFSEDY
jgi:hypothetical protein